MAPEVARPRAVTALLAVLAAAAAGLLAVLTVTTLHHPNLREHVDSVVIAAALAAPILARYGVSVEGRAQTITITFETAALVLLLLVAPPMIGLTLWCCLVPLGLIGNLGRWRVHLFNVSLTIICGVSLALTVTTIGHADPSDPLTLLAVAAGCTVSTLIDLGLSWLHVHLRTGKPIASLIGADDILIGTGVTLGTASVGYLGGALHRVDTPWVMFVLLIPVASVIVASRATRMSLDNQRRLSVLLDSSRDRRHLESVDEILGSASRHAKVLLGSEVVSIDPAPPQDGQIGAPIDAGDGVVWLKGSPRRDRSTWLPSERQALDTLAADTAESLSRAQLISELSRMARHDGLSGLANRTTFTAEVAHRLHTQSRRRPTLLYLDLDNFKQVNDLYGHHSGDELVRQVAQRLRESIPADGVAARLGGDEFAVLLGSARELDTVSKLLSDALSREFHIDGKVLRVSTSIGAAVAEPGLLADDLFRRADRAMYFAKASESDRVAVYHDGLRAADEERARLRAELSRALDNDELRVFYQPVQDLRSGVIDGVEALVRWEHPTRGLLSAGEFVELAEQSGLIGRIGEWVLRRAMADSAKMAQAAGRPLSVAVNVSPRQLVDDAIVHIVSELVGADRWGTHLVLELTESAIITEDPVIQARLEKLINAGASLALDDFGVGYSSVGYLRWLPMQILKLDRSLLTNVIDDPRARMLLDALLAMARALNFTVIAEGIERAEQARVLHELGCPLGQGWWLSRPLPLTELEDLLAGPAPMTQPLIRRQVTGA